jgi:SAM-dependent methyltransferase
VITSDQEKAFYDDQYRQFLTLPDHALRIDREVLLGNIASPANPFHERRLLYSATMKALTAEPLEGLRVLDYGCGPADFGVWMATEGANATLLDLSATAVELGLKRAKASGVQERVQGVAADASTLPMFADRSFDLVFACAALHHTLKYPGAVQELARIMRPGARLVLCETWGGNPVLNSARQLRAWLQGEKEEQGEDILIDHHELRRLDSYFNALQIEHLNLFGMAKRLMRGRFGSPIVSGSLRALEALDRALLRSVPALSNWCGEAVIVARRSN